MVEKEASFDAESTRLPQGQFWSKRSSQCNLKAQYDKTFNLRNLWMFTLSWSLFSVIFHQIQWRLAMGEKNFEKKLKMVSKEEPPDTESTYLLQGQYKGQMKFTMQSDCQIWENFWCLYWVFWIHTSIHLSICSSVCSSVNSSIHQFLCLCKRQFVCMSVCLSVWLTVCTSVRSSACLFIWSFVFLSLCRFNYSPVCLCVSLTVHLSVYSPACLSICLSILLLACPSACLFIRPSVVTFFWLTVHQSTCLYPVHMSVCSSLHLYVRLSIRPIKKDYTWL